jgi:hypothetical protein
MADIVVYLSVFLMVAISGAGLFPDFVTNTTKAQRIGLFVLLVAAAIFALVSLHEGNVQHDRDSGRIIQLQSSVTQADQRQQASAQQFIQGQKEATGIFVLKYDELSARLAALQTGIKTANLQQEADGIRKDLKATRAALVVPKAKLTFSLTNTIKPTVSESLPVKDGVVHISFYILNNGTVDALDGDIVLIICKDCSYAKEQPSFVRLAGAPDYQRNYSFQHILAHSGVQLLEADIKVNPNIPVMDFGVMVICRTCETAPVGTPSPDMVAHITLLRSQ